MLDYLRARGAEAFTTHDAKHRPCTPGIPDILAIKDGCLYAIECKTPTGRLTEEQDSFLARLKAKGATTIIAREVEDVARYL